MARQNIIVKKKWRIGSPKQWQDYNTYFNKLTESNMLTDVPELTNIIIKSLYKTIGKATIKNGKQKNSN